MTTNPAKYNDKIQQLVDKGYTQAAFKYKENAERFMNLWERKGYHVGWFRSSGAVVDDEGRIPNAYYCIAEKEKPKPLTLKQKQEVDEYKRLLEMSIKDPGRYWREYTRERLMKRGAVDPEIRELIFELNENQQFTISSCAGHGDKRGHVFIKKEMHRGNIVRNLMKRYGVSDVRRDEKDYIDNYGRHYIVYTFRPVGRNKR